MAKINTTKELFDMFFAEKDSEYARKVRGQVDRKEVYDYERKIGKQLIEMSADELLDMISTFSDRRSAKNENYTAAKSYMQISSLYRAIFNYYSMTDHLIWNPFYEDKMRGGKAIWSLLEEKDRFTKEKFYNIINRIHSYYEDNRANYLECILLLFYCGFRNAKEIVDLTENQIDFDTRKVELSDRTVKLSDRCLYLLRNIHHMDVIETEKGDRPVVFWRDRYFKHIILERNVGAFNSKTLEDVAMSINQRISREVKRVFSVDVNYRVVYLLGFYDYMVERCGKDHTNEIITSVRNSDRAKELASYASDYGVFYSNITVLKESLRIYVEK